MSEPPYKPKFNTKYEIIGLLQTEPDEMVVDCWQYLRGRPRSRVVLEVSNMDLSDDNEMASVGFLKHVPGTIGHELPAPLYQIPGNPVDLGILLIWLTDMNVKFKGTAP